MRELELELDLFLQSPHLHLLDAWEMGGRFAVPCIEQVRNLNPKGRYARYLKAEKREVNNDWRMW